MRVILLAAIIGVVAPAVSAQPVKMGPLPYGAETPIHAASLHAALPATPSSITVQVPVLVAAVGAGSRVSELEPQGRVAKVKAQIVRAEPLRSTDLRVETIEPHGSSVAEIPGGTAPVTRLGGPISPAPKVRTADLQPRKINSQPSTVFPIVYASLQPSKMSPGIPGLTGAMRYVESPWLDHAIDDLGTNPTGWKRVWCARSLNMWLQKSGRRGCGSDAAISCLEAGERLPEPRIGAIAVLKHHVGIVKEVHDGHVTLVSGNNRGKPGARTVGISKFKRASIVGYVWPE